MRKKLTMNKLGLAGLALLAFAIAGCENNGGGGGVPVTGVAIFFNGTLAPNEIDLWISPYGDDNAQRSALLEARVFPANAGNSSVTWSSSVIWSSNDNDVVNVNNGNVTVNDTPGLVTITATTIDGSHTSSAVIRVHGRPTESGNQSEHAGDLIILQAAAVAGGTGNNAHRTFVELYNRSNAAIDMDGLSLQWTGGQGDIWNVIPLSGDLPAGHSFLVLGIVGDADARLQIPNAYADKLLPDFQLNNRAFRLALMEGTMPLTVHNPSYMGHDGTIDLRTLIPATGSSEATVGTQTAAGLIDLLGVVNTRADNRDIIHGAKGAPAYRISNQTSIRRANLDDATNNFNDFRGIDWQARAGAVADDQIAVFIPRNRAAGAWTPEFPEPNWAPPPPPPPPEDVPLAERIIILQANRSGNDNGGGGGFQAALVELFNLTDGTINLAGYYLHFGSGTGTAADPATTWNYVVPLTGTIPARSSFLVVSRTDTNDVFRADLPVADQEADFILNATANHWSVALMTRSTPFTGNPFTDEALWSYYVDMLGAGSNAASETAFASTSQPQGPRRRSIVDTNNNGADFGQADFRGHWGGTARTPNAELYRIWPRNSSAGAWDPITGIPQVHPTVRNPTTDGEVEFPAP